MKIPTYLNHKNFLKVYLVLIITLVLYVGITDEDPMALIDYIDSGFFLITLAGMFGYIFNKEFITKKFWQFYLPVIVIWDIFGLSYTNSFLSQIDNTLNILFSLIIFYTLMTPLYITLYLYGHQGVEASVKKRTKISLVIIFILLSTNAITYLLTYKDANFQFDLYNTASKITTLKLLENNVPETKKFLSISINPIFFDANLKDNIEKYSPLCKYLDNNTFSILKKYQYESNDTRVIEPMIYSSYEITQGTKEGKEKVIEMCKHLKAEEK